MNNLARSPSEFRKFYLEVCSSTEFDEVLILAQSLCEVSHVALSFVDTDRMWELDDMRVKVTSKSKYRPHPKSFHSLTILKNSRGEELGELVVSDLASLKTNLNHTAGLSAIAALICQKLDREMSIHLERAATEEIFEKQTQFLDAVLENQTDGVVACNARGELTVFNRATKEFHGLDSRSDIPPSEWSKYFSLYLEDGKTLMREDQIPLRRVFSGEILDGYEMVIKSVTGESRRLRCAGRAMYDKQGVKLGAVLSMHDVTALHLAKGRVASANKAMQDLIENCPVGIGVFNQDFEFTVWNAWNEKIFGWTKEEALAKFSDGEQHESMKSEQLQNITDMMHEVLNTKTKVQKTFRSYRKNNTNFEVQMTMLPLFDEHNKISSFMAVAIDISDLKEIEKNLLDSNRALQAASMAKSAFLTNMSHEIRTPLNGVLGMTDLMHLTNLTEDQQRYLGVIKSSGLNLLTIISDILDYSKIESEKLEVQNVNFDLEELLKDIYSAMGPSAGEKQLTLALEIFGDANRRFRGDPGRIRQVLYNLVSNAIKFSTHGEIRTTIQIDTPKDGKSQLHFAVMDRGLGISPTILDNLFQAFALGDASSTRRQGGTGLGLSICKGLVEHMGGSIGVDSQLGNGSSFWFNIPLEVVNQIKDQTPAKAQNIPTEILSKSNLRILIAEDNPTNQMIILAMVQKLGHVGGVAHDGKQALSLLKSNSYDCILMDCLMPEMDGYEATRIIRSQEGYPTDIPIIAVTANAMQGDREKCLEAGMTDYLTKPLKLSVLQDLLEKYFAAAELQQAL